MITDISLIPSGTQFQADLCIIGSGAAGLALAREFIGKTSSVIILEGGGERFEHASQDPYRGHVVGRHHGGIHSGRARVLGGTTTLWAGQALPLLDVDFKKRDWVPNSGWPIQRQALEPYYRRAENVMEVPHVSNDVVSWPSPRTPPPYDPEKFLPWFSQFAPTPNFAKRYREQIHTARNLSLITHANVTSIEASPNASRSTSVTVRSFDKRTVTVCARFFVICCGGIESARLLLLSDSVEPNGIGNGNDLVGRFFQDHPGFAVPICRRDPAAFSRYYDSFRTNGIRYGLKVVASETLQSEFRILNTGAEVYYPSSPDDPIAAGKELIRLLKSPRDIAELPAAVARILRRPAAITAAAYRYFIRGQPASVGSGEPLLGVGCEQQPNSLSRVTLSRDLDCLGMRRTVLDWRLTGEEARSITVFLHALKEEWARLDLADIGLTEQNLPNPDTQFVDANHHMGTTRMGDEPRSSVVDSRCRVHGYENLYIASSSVFPTSGFSNPTLTILALCLRIADEIKDLLASN